jgi:glycosyltransferase involved in cell wall biosynthesis
MAQGHEVIIFRSDVSRFDGKAASSEAGSRYRDQVDGGLTVRSIRGVEYRGNAKRFLGMVRFGRAVVRGTRGLSKPDIVMGTSVHLFAAHAAQRLAARYRVPFILEIGDIWPQTLVDIGAIKRWHPVYVVQRVLEKHLYRRAARVLSKLPLAKDHIAASGSDPGKVAYLPNSVDLRPYLSATYPEAPPPRSEFRVAYMGSMTPVYGLTVLIDAAATIAADHPDLPIRFRLVGSGNSRPALEDHAASLGLKNMEFVDRIPWDDVPIELAEADVCLAISRSLAVVRSFGMSQNKVYEYMGAARPVIFAVDAANDPVAESDGGLSVAAENRDALVDAILRMFDMTREDRIAMGKRAHDYVAGRFAAELITRRFTLILQETLTDRPPGSLVHPDELA